MTISRRSLITGLISLVAAPAIVRAGSLMPIKVMGPESYLFRAMRLYAESELGIFTIDEVDALCARYETRRHAFAGLGHRFNPIEAFGWQT
jgi:hypothetical protein